ncbi:neutral zinc metallopeptidase [Nonomuraea sp. NPDC048826]|uniref:neutral zinc metallopeptidase n=1 Tax=Nonomuraea sp. NPDC048826 TaxID=3364347 RepID=UPI003711FDC4
MKKLASLTAAGVVIALAGTGTAVAQTHGVQAGQQVKQQVSTQRLATQLVSTQQANPRGKTAATRNPLYRSGRLTGTNCSPGGIQRGSTAAYKRFLQRMTNCLNRAWGNQFRKAKLSFSKPRLRIVTRKVNTACGRWVSGAAGVYCSTNRTMYMLITKRELRDPYPAGIARLMAHEYGHHVQTVSGIGSYYYPARARAGRSAGLLLSRRLELQAECFSAVFMRTISNSLPVTQQDWDHIVSWFRENGHKGWAQNDHGKGRSQAFWMERGFNSAQPGSCNTWSVSSRYVA